MAPHARPPSTSEGSSDQAPSPDPASADARLDNPRPSSHPLFSPDSIKSVDSADSVPVLGAYPLGSLHIHAPPDDEQPMMDHDNATAAAPPPHASEKVQRLLRSGDAVVLADLPVGFTVGCDAISFTSTERFLGFRDVPPGAHLVWVAPSESTSSRSAFWFYTPEDTAPGPGKVYVKQWDKFNELLGDPASQAETRFQRERLDDNESLAHLVPYRFPGSPHADAGRPGDRSARGDESPPPPLEGSTMWYQLTHAIRPGLLDRITGGPKETWPVHTSDQVTGEPTLAAEGRLYATHPAAPPPLRFTFPADQKLFDAAAEGAERTSQALDPTAWVLAQLERRRTDDDDDDNASPNHRHDDDLVGELQFLFLTGMHLGNYSCLAQWWHYATRVVFRSYRLAAERPALARALVQAVHAQLVYDDAHLAGSVLDAAPARGGRRALQRALTVYRSRLRELLPPNTTTTTAAAAAAAAPSSSSSSAQQAVGAAFDALAAWLAARWDWDLAADYVRSGTVMLEDGEMVQVDISDFEDEDERGEFAAVVVDVDDDGRPRDFISV